MKPIILSLFDYSGGWSEPFAARGYRVISVDIKLGIDVMEWAHARLTPGLVAGILAAPPCTDFSVSGAQYWPAKDADGRTDASVRLVRRVLGLVAHLKPRFWVLENPVGRLERLVPELKSHRRMLFNPCDYGDAYTKKTILWGNFNTGLTRIPVEPIRTSSQGSWLQNLGGKSERTKELRSVTPPGFARAFCDANFSQQDFPYQL